jgi:hypothetical protein
LAVPEFFHGSLIANVSLPHQIDAMGERESNLQVMLYQQDGNTGLLVDLRFPDPATS